MIHVGRWKLVYQPIERGALYKLFDLETAPACQHNRIEDEPEWAESLKQKLLAWVAADAEVRGYECAWASHYLSCWCFGCSGMEDEAAPHWGASDICF